MSSGVSARAIQVLLVEDAPGDVLLISQILAKEPFPIRVHAAVDGAQAAQMVVEQQFTPDLVILDLNLPRVPGMLFLEGFDKTVPVVVFSSSSNPADRQRAMELGAKDYVVKPTDLTEYTQLVSQIVRKWTGRDAGAVSAR